MQPRIVSLAPSATSILCALGAKKQLVGVTRWCKDVAPVDGLPTFGDCWRAEPEGVAKLKPTLVIGSVPYGPGVVDAYLRSGLPFLAMNPRTLADIFADIRMLGGLLGREQRAAAVVRTMKARMNRVAARARRVYPERVHRERARRRPRVYVEVWANPFIVAPRWVEEMVALVGGRFVPTPGGRKVTEPEVLRAAPEIMIVAWAAVGLRADTRKILHRPGWSSLPAFRRDQVYLVSDETVNTPGPVVVEGLERLASLIHPEIFGRRRDRKVVQIHQEREGLWATPRKS